MKGGALTCKGALNRRLRAFVGELAGGLIFGGEQREEIAFDDLFAGQAKERFCLGVGGDELAQIYIENADGLGGVFKQRLKLGKRLCGVAVCVPPGAFETVDQQDHHLAEHQNDKERDHPIGKRGIPAL